MVIRNIQDFLIDQLDRLQQGSRLAVVLDPERRLQLNEELRCKRRWRVYQYAENDLDFRARYGSGPDDPNEQHVVWITFSPFRRVQAAPLDLSYVTDVLRRAERIFDLSLEGVLRVLVPNEVFPKEGLRMHGEVIASHLDAFVTAHRELRRQIGERQPLALHHLRALLMKCLQPELTLAQCLFDGADSSALLQQYLALACSGQLNDQVVPLLRAQVMSSSPTGTESLRPWVEAAPDDAALAIYLYRLLQTHAVPNPLNQLRGLGLLTVDATMLQPLLDTTARLWDNRELRLRLITRAEAAFPTDRVSEVAALLPLPTPMALGEAMKGELAPAILYGLAERLLSEVVTGAAGGAADLAFLSAITMPETQYTARAQAAFTILRETAFIREVLARKVADAQDLATLLERYVASGAYRLEFACSMATAQVAQVLSLTVRRQAVESLENLTEQVHAYLKDLDASLVALVAPDPAALWAHPRLSSNILSDLVLRASIAPTTDNALWIVVFDGMRWDSWRETVRPLLLEHFEITADEKPYLSPLPSTTLVARTAFFAGCAPASWRAPDGRATKSEELLLARLLDVSARDMADRIRYETRSEHRASRAPRPYDLNRRPVNVLIYKISDGWIHDFPGDLVALNKRIEQEVAEVVADLRTMVLDGDVIVLTSDHGFTELDPDARIPVAGPQEQVVYRFLVDLENAEGLHVPYSPERFYTVAKARTWFLRERGRYTRYSHGGVTLAEMVVPGLMLRKISEPTVKLLLTGLPQHPLVVDENQPRVIEVRIANAGNQSTTYSLVFAANTDKESIAQRGALGPQESQDHAFTLTPVYSPRKTERVTLTATFVDVDGRQRATPSRYIEIETRPRTDVVEIDFGGLDKLDDL